MLPRIVAALLLIAATFVAPAGAASITLAGSPNVSPALAGSRVAGVSVETYGSVRPATVWRYLALRRGGVLDQEAVDRDYRNLVMLGGFRVRLQIEPATDANAVMLHWIVMAKWLKPTDHPFYADQPLTAPIQGLGFVLTAPPINDSGAGFSAYSQLSRRANLARVLFTDPISVDATKERESDFVVDTFGGRGVYRASQPLAINIYSWTSGNEMLYLLHGTSGTQLELGIRQQRSTTAESSGIVAPSLYSTNVAPARNVVLEAGLSHACRGGPALWHYPYCKVQYRFEAFDAPGWFGATSEYQSYIGDVARYFPVGVSTMVLHATAARTGGVVPDSFLVCTGARAYPKGFCGTDAQVVTAEFRLNDATKQPLKFAFFTETAASRIRGGDQPWALPTFQWHPDSGVGIIFRDMLRLDIAYGTEGGRLSIALQGQTF